METLKTCNSCFFDFDAKEHAPRVLPCGHTICSKCLIEIRKRPKSQKCPFDGIAFLQNSLLDSFPLNFVVMDLLEQRKNDVCRIHPDGKLKWLCLTERKKICAECVRIREHHGHKIKKIKALKARGFQAKGELQETLGKIEESEQEKEADCERARKAVGSTVITKRRELENILIEKESKWVNQVNDLFDSLKAQNILVIKEQMKEKIKNITLACEDDGDLALLDKEINEKSIFKVEPQLLKEKFSQICNKAFDMKKLFQESFDVSKREINSLELPSKDFIKEIALSEEQALMAVKFKSYFDISQISDGLRISTGSFLAKDYEVNKEDFQANEKVYIELKRSDLLNQEPQINVISYLLRRLKRFTSLDVSFLVTGFDKASLLWLENIISEHLWTLNSFDLDLEKCVVNKESMRILCDRIFSKMINLKDFYLNCNSSRMKNANLEILANSLIVFHKNIEFFALGLAKNDIDDSGIIRIFQEIKSMEVLKDLQFFLSKTKITDLSLEVFGKEILPCLQSLNSLTLCLKKNDISDQGIMVILKSLLNLKNLKRLELYLSRTLITDDTVEFFVEEIMPRLESLETLSFIVKKTQVSNENLQKIQEISKAFNKKNNQGIEMEIEMIEEEPINFCSQRFDYFELDEKKFL